MAPLRQQAEPQVLDLVGVLVLVDHDVLEALAVLLQHLAVLPEHIEHVQQQVAKIAGVQRLEAILVEPVELLAASVGVAFVLQRIEIAGIEPAVLPAVDQPGELARRPALFVEPFGLDELLQEPELVVGVDDRVVGLQTHELGVAAEHLGGDRVEGAEPGHTFHRRADHVAHTLAHLARRLVGEGDAEDLARPGEAAPDQMRHARGQRRGLAGARAGQHQHRPLGGQHRFALRRVERTQQRIGIAIERRGGGVRHG